jgi:PAS domain-containing protein
MTLLAPLLDDHAAAAAALDGLRDGVLVVSGGEVLVANRAAHALMGRGPGELAGGPAADWVAGAEARGGAIEVALPAARADRRRPRPLQGRQRRARPSGRRPRPRRSTTGRSTARLAEEAERLSARGCRAPPGAAGARPSRSCRPRSRGRRALGAEEALAQVERLSERQFVPGAAGLVRDALQWWDVAA